MNSCDFTRHNLESIEPLALKIGNNFVSFLLLGRFPLFDMMQNVDARRGSGFDGKVLIFAEDGFVHGRKINYGDCKGSVHVKNHSPEARFDGFRSGLKRHGDGG